MKTRLLAIIRRRGFPIFAVAVVGMFVFGCLPSRAANVGGVTASVAGVVSAQAEEKNLVPNPGFEAEHETRKGTPKSWNTDWTLFNTNTFWTQEDVHSGEYSIKLILTNKNDHGITWSSPLIPVKGNARYKFSFWAKCPETSRYGVLINVLFLDKDKQFPAFSKDEPRGNWWLAFEQKGPFDWHKFSRWHRTPPEACYATLSLIFAYSAGQVYCDDVSFEAEEKKSCEERKSWDVLKRWKNLIKGERR